MSESRKNRVLPCLSVYPQLSALSQSRLSAHALPLAPRPSQVAWRLNTCNPSKLVDFKRLLGQHDITLCNATRYDLPEIDADPVRVLVHKASQILSDFVLAEDTSFDVHGANIGVNIRWLVASLPQYVGHQACLVTLLGYKHADRVYVYEGIVTGTIVPECGPRDKGFEINAHFLPTGRTETLAQCDDDSVNPRAIAVAAFAQHRPSYVQPAMTAWDGPWQAQSNAPLCN